MGSSTMLDLIGSFAVAGILMLMAMRLNASANESSAIYNGSAILQSNMTTFVEMIESDFRKIGYCRDWTKIPNPTRAIRIADSSRLRFWTDVDNNGTIDSITYYLGPTSELSGTVNPRDRYMYRQVNAGTPQSMNLGVTQFSLRYFDAENDPLSFPIANPQLVYFMQVSIAVESAEPYQQEYMDDASQYEVFWKQIRLVTKNLKNR